MIREAVTDSPPPLGRGLDASIVILLPMSASCNPASIILDEDEFTARGRLMGGGDIILVRHEYHLCLQLP